MIIITTHCKEAAIHFLQQNSLFSVYDCIYASVVLAMLSLTAPTL